MASLGVRLLGGAIGAIIQAPFIAAGSGLFGYIYAKLADLPAEQVAKAWVIWSVVEGTILAIACSFTENRSFQSFIRIIVMTAMTMIGMQEMHKRGLIGENMLICVMVVKIIGIAGVLLHGAPARVEIIPSE